MHFIGYTTKIYRFTTFYWSTPILSISLYHNNKQYLNKLIESITQIINLNLSPKMLYDTYGEEYLDFLQDLNEILSINELAELDYM